MDFELYMVGQALTKGLAMGSLYALIGLGFVLLFKSTNVVNFAQGEAVMLGGYAGIVLYGLLGLPYPVALPLVMGCGALLGVLTDRVLRRLIEAPMLSLIIATVGISIVLKSSARLIAGPHPLIFPQVFPSQPIALGRMAISFQDIWLLGVLVVSVILFYLFFYRTKMGLAMRAVSENREAASLMGISVPKVFQWTWAIGGAVGALGGLLFAPIVMVEPDMGLLMLLPAFSAAVLGGFGSLPGVVAGGWAIGILENVLGLYLGSAVKEFVPFLVIFAVLVIKPTGFFGGK